MLDIVYVYFVGGGELRTFSVLVFSMFFLLRGGGRREGTVCFVVGGLEVGGCC